MIKVVNDKIILFLSFIFIIYFYHLFLSFIFIIYDTICDTICDTIYDKIHL